VDITTMLYGAPAAPPPATAPERPAYLDATGTVVAPAPVRPAARNDPAMTAGALALLALAGLVTLRMVFRGAVP
jgi:hypothetical protein